MATRATFCSGRLLCSPTPRLMESPSFWARAGKARSAREKPCERCGTQNPGASNFCFHCGWPFGRAPLAPPPVEEPKDPFADWSESTERVELNIELLLDLNIYCAVRVQRKVGGSQAMIRRPAPKFVED